MVMPSKLIEIGRRRMVDARDDRVDDLAEGLDARKQPEDTEGAQFNGDGTEPAAHAGERRWARAKRSCCFKLLRICSVFLLSVLIAALGLAWVVNVDQSFGIFGGDVGNYKDGTQWAEEFGPNSAAKVAEGRVHGKRT